MIKKDNPAGRLHKLLLDDKSKPPNTAMKQVWAEVFGLDASNTPAIFTNLVRLQDSVNEIEKSIRMQEVDHDIYLQSFPSIRTILSLPNLDSSINQHVSLINEGVLMTLQFCSERLSKTCPEHVPTDDEIKELIEQIQNLADSILASSINKTLKVILSELTESMRQALAEYRIRGGTGLREELFSILERLQRTFPILEQHKTEPEVKLFWEILSKYDTITSICVNAPAVLSGFQQVLQLMP